MKIAILGTHKGEMFRGSAGEYCAMLRRLVVIQGDTEPAWSSNSAISARPRLAL